jgi:hypothetical protein
MKAEAEFNSMAMEGTQSYFDSKDQREPFAMLHRGM